MLRARRSVVRFRGFSARVLYELCRELRGREGLAASSAETVTNLREGLRGRQIAQDSPDEIYSRAPEVPRNRVTTVDV